MAKIKVKGSVLRGATCRRCRARIYPVEEMRKHTERHAQLDNQHLRDGIAAINAKLRTPG